MTVYKAIKSFFGWIWNYSSEKERALFEASKQYAVMRVQEKYNSGVDHGLSVKAEVLKENGECDTVVLAISDVIFPSCRIFAGLEAGKVYGVEVYGKGSVLKLANLKHEYDLAAAVSPVLLNEVEAAPVRPSKISRRINLMDAYDHVRAFG